MRTRVLKECRSLLLPAGLVLGATVASLALYSVTGVFRGQQTLAMNMAVLGFFLGTAFLVASSFGAEFQQRTIVLLLTQPISRARIWLEKWLVLVGVVAALAAIELAALRFGLLAREETVTRGAFYLLMMVCSAAFWTLVARSTIGGLAFSLSAIMMLELASSYVTFRITGTQLREDVFAITPALAAVRVAYSALTLWLGWLVFSRFQAAGAGFGEASAGVADATPRWSLLRSRPTGVLANLVRKELNLQRPTFLVAFMFSACWLATTAFLYLQLSRVRFAEATFALLLAVYVPLVTLLAGTISIGEETTHGTREWHLTLPVSTRVQWIVKLCVTLVVGLALAIGLPWALGTLAAAARPIEGDNVPVALIHPIFILFVTGALVLSFWAATLAGHTVRAVVLTGLTLLGLSLVASFGSRWGFSWGIGTGLMTDLMVRLQLPPDYFYQPVFVTWAPAAILVIMSAAALWQSLSAFRRAHTDTRTTARYTLTLLAIALVVAASPSNFMEASRRQFSAGPMLELRAGLQALSTPERVGPASGPRQVTLAELERVTRLSASTRQWLANTEISIEFWAVQPQKKRAAYRATLQFPGHRKYAFLYFVQ